MAASQPSGTVTFLFTDVETSTPKWDEQPEIMREAMARHDQICRATIEGHHGYVFSTGGDGFGAAFQRASDAVSAALAMQLQLRSEPWPETCLLRVRIGVHTGEADERDGDYFGLSVNRAARIMAAACGGQIVVSATTADMIVGGSDLILVDLGPVDLRGLKDPVRVFGVATPAVPWLDRPLAAVRTSGGNLPVATDDFVGRGEELQRLADSLRSRHLLTLTGVGGVGKTRLAIELGWLVAGEFPDGVWMVALAPLSDPDAVATVIASTLGIRPQPDEPLLDSIIDVLRSKRLLLVVDNCEHLLASVGPVAGAITGGCPSLRLVATSREALGQRGEQVHAVVSLGGQESFELFCDRARLIDDGFVASEDDRVAIEGICRRLDGIPLAIELAAARTRSLTPADVLSRLDDRFRLLRGGRGGADRHQTLQATVAWSYQLASDIERTVFDRLSVFAGGFDLDAAEAVCGFGEIEPSAVLDTLASLVDKSMVHADRRGRYVRYRLLETLRQFGEDRLAERGDNEVLNERHGIYVLDLAGRIGVMVNGPDQLRGLALLEREWDEFRAAHAWAISSGNGERAALLLVATGMASMVLMRHEGAEWVNAVRDVLPDDHALRPLIDFLAAMWASVAGDHDTAIGIADAALGRQPPGGMVASLLWGALGTAYVNSGRPAEAMQAIRTAIELADDDLSESMALLVAVWCAWAGDRAAVAGYAARLDAPGGLSQAPLGRASVEFSHGVAHLIDGQPEVARRRFEESLRLSQHLRGPAKGQALQGIATAAAAMRADDTPIAFHDALTYLYDDIRYWMYLWIVIETLAVYWTETGDLDGGALLLGHLEAHHHSHATLLPGRQGALATLTQHPELAGMTRNGATLDRDQIVAYSLNRLQA